jgi:predicted MFS family arabinose efflux permease
VTVLDGRSARLALGTASALGLGRFSFGLLVPAMSDELHWNLSRAGALTTANGLGYLAGAVATAAVARAIGVPATFRLGLVLCAASLAATAASPGYVPLLTARAVTGVGGALVFIAGAVLAPGVVYFAGAGLGIALSGATIPPLLAGHPERWQAAWLGLAAAAAVAAAVAWPAAGAQPATDHARPATDPSPPAAYRPLWTIATAYLLFAGGYIAYVTFLSTYLVAHGASAARTALTWTLLGVAVTAAPIVWQRPITRRPDGRTLAVALGALAAAALLALTGSGSIAMALSAAAYGVTFMAVPAAVTAAVRVATPPERLTRRLARFTILFAAGQTAGPYVAGVLADRTGPAATLAWTAALCGAGAAFAATHRYQPSYRRS